MKNYVTLQERIEEMNKNLHPAGDREEDGLDKAAEQHRSQKKRTLAKLSIVATTMCASETLILAQLIVQSLKTLRRSHGQSIVMQKTQLGSVMHISDMARGGYEAELQDMAAHLGDPEFLKKLEFTGPDTVEGELTIERETMLGHYCWRLHLHLLGSHLLSSCGVSATRGASRWQSSCFATPTSRSWPRACSTFGRSGRPGRLLSGLPMSTTRSPRSCTTLSG